MYKKWVYNNVDENEVTKIKEKYAIFTEKIAKKESHINELFYIFLLDLNIFF